MPKALDVAAQHSMSGPLVAAMHASLSQQAPPPPAASTDATTTAADESAPDAARTVLLLDALATLRSRPGAPGRMHAVEAAESERGVTTLEGFWSAAAGVGADAPSLLLIAARAAAAHPRKRDPARRARRRWPLTPRYADGTGDRVSVQPANIYEFRS